jgi:hypothetical protein
MKEVLKNLFYLQLICDNLLTSVTCTKMIEGYMMHNKMGRTGYACFSNAANFLVAFFVLK